MKYIISFGDGWYQTDAHGAPTITYDKNIAKQFDDKKAAILKSNSLHKVLGYDCKVIQIKS